MVSSPAACSDDETQSIDELSDDDEEDDSSERKEQLVAHVELLNNGQPKQSLQLHHGLNIIGRQSVKHARDSVRAESWRSAGPSSQNAILLEAPKLSAKHVCIGVDGHKCFVTDLGSKNGSWLNSASRAADSVTRQRLQPYRSHPIHDGDILLLADVQLFLKLQRKSQESSMVESQPSRLQLNMSASEKQENQSEAREPHHSGDVPAAADVPAGKSRTFARISSLREWQQPAGPRHVVAAEETQIVDVGGQAMQPAATAEQTQILPVTDAKAIPDRVPDARVTAEELALLPAKQLDNIPENRSGTQESIPNSNSDEPLLCSEQLVLTNSSQSPKKPPAPASLKRRGSRLALVETAVAPSNASPDSADQADAATPPSFYYPSILNTDALGTANNTSYRSDAHAPAVPNSAHEEAREHEYEQPAEAAAALVGKPDTSLSASDATTMSDAGADDGVDDAKSAPAIDVHSNIADAFVTEMESSGAPSQTMQAANTAPAPLYATHTQAQLLDTQDTSQLAAAANQALDAVAGMVAAVTSSQAPDSAPVASLWRLKPEHKLSDSGNMSAPLAHGSPIGACTQDVANILIQQLPSVAERRLSFGNALAHEAPLNLVDAPVGNADVALAEPSSSVPKTEVNSATDAPALAVATKTVDVDDNDEALTPRIVTGRKRKGKHQPAAKASRPSPMEVPEAAQDTPDEPRSTRRAAAPSPMAEDQPAVKRQRAHKLDVQQPAAAADIPVRVLFSTSLKDNLQLVKQAERLGAEITQLVTDCTHFVAQEFKRTVHMLSAIAAGVWVVRPGWVEASARLGSFQDASKYLLRDKKQEKQHCFSMEQSLQRARRGPVFTGLSFIITPGVSNPSAEDVAAIIRAAGGDVVDDPAEAEDKSKVLVVACEADMASCKQYAAADVPVHTNEFVLRSVVTQQLHDKHAHRLGVCPGPTTGKRSGKRKAAQ